MARHLKSMQCANNQRWSAFTSERVHPYLQGYRCVTREPGAVSSSASAFRLCTAVEAQGIDLWIDGQQLSLAYKVHLVLELDRALVRAQLRVWGQGQTEQGLKASIDPGEPEV